MQTLSSHYANRPHLQNRPPCAAALTCYYHHGPQTSAHRASKLATKLTDAKLEIEPIADPASISLNADRILRALASNQISPGKAAILFQGLQTVLASFRLPPIESRDFPSADAPGATPQSCQKHQKHYE